MAEKKVDLEVLLNRAKEQEKKYDWSGAAETYVNALQSVQDQDLSRTSEILERKAYAQYRASFQVSTNEAFKEGIKKALESYGKARISYEKINRRDSSARISRCYSMISCLKYWQMEQARDKKKSIGAAWDYALEAANGFMSSNSKLEYARTFVDLWFCAAILFNYAEDFEGRKKPIIGALEFGEQAVGFFDGTGEREELTAVLVRTAILERVTAGWLVDLSNVQKHIQKSYDYWCRAKELDENVSFADLGWSNLLSGVAVDLSLDPAKEMPVYQKALEYARRTGDRLMIGCALEILAYCTGWPVSGIEDPERRESVSNEALRLALGAGQEFAVISFQSPNWSAYWANSPNVGHLASLAMNEINIKKKLELLQRALAEAPEEVRLAEETQYPAVEQSALFYQGFLLKELAKTNNDREARRRLLEQALEYGRRQLAIEEKYDLYHFMNLSLSHNLLADLLHEIAKNSDDRETKIDMLREAIQHDNRTIEVSTKGMRLWAVGDPAVASVFSDFYMDHGRRLRLLHQMTNETNCLRGAAEAFEKSVKLALEADSSARAAEGDWEAATTCDMMQDHLKAAEWFKNASENYRAAMEKIPSLKDFYKDFIFYMKAWAEIEHAKHRHARQEPSQAKEHYNKAAELHESTAKWRYLSTNYSAWAHLENAEDLSQGEGCKESIEAFREAARLFKASEMKMRDHLADIESPDEKQMVEMLIHAADNRQELCKARIALEEARLMDKGGNLSGASEKYGLVADMFDKIRQGLDAEQDRKEIELIITLSKAWEAMAKAEAESSPQLYEDAARLFDEAKNLSPGDKAKNLAMGHSRLCMALGAGARYADVPESTLHAAAVQNLESAAKYYLKADLQSAAEYAKASKLLFDGYAYMNRAGREEDQEKRTKFYTMAEKVLQASASSYEKADQPGKKEQVLKLLAKVQQDKELATSLTEILRAPDVVSTTMAFSSPTPTYETAVGLDRFEHADIQANLISPKRELKVDEDLILGIELVNAGRGPAQLIKLQDIIPKGFTLREEAGGYRMEDSYLDLRGKRLDALKTEEINLVLKPVHRGQFTLKPRILYLDESGKYKSHEPEPMRITVGADAMVAADQAFSLDTREAAEARSLLAGLNVVTLSHYRIVGNYVRYGKSVCNDLKDARQKIVAACQNPSPKRENYIIWAPPGSGKTYFVQEVAALLRDSVHFRELNLAKLDETGFRSGLAELRGLHGPCLCLVDEVDSKPNEPWPYEALMPFLDASATEGARLVFVLAGSSGSSLGEMKKTIASRPKGSDILTRVPTENEYSIPPMGVGDRLLVVLSQFRQAGKQMGHNVREVEKLGLYYVALNPRLSNARQLREFAVRCAERVLPGDDRLKYDSLFRPGDVENKLFWTQALQSAGVLVDSFLLVED
jgi:hypothetical protein